MEEDTGDSKSKQGGFGPMTHLPQLSQHIPASHGRQLCHGITDHWAQVAQCTAVPPLIVSTRFHRIQRPRQLLSWLSGPGATSLSSAITLT